MRLAAGKPKPPPPSTTMTAAAPRPEARFSAIRCRSQMRKAEGLYSRTHNGKARRERSSLRRRLPTSSSSFGVNDGEAETSTVVVDAPSASDALVPPLLPGAEAAAAANGVGVTALDPSSLPALDAAGYLQPEDERQELLLLSPPLSDDGVAPSSSSSSVPSAPPSFLPGFLTPAVRGMIAINLGAALFGSNMVAVKLAQSGGASPAAMSAGRFAIAALVFLPSAARALRSSQPSSSSSTLRKSGLELGLWLFAGYTGQAVGLSMTTASRGAFSSAFTVLAVPMLQAALGDGRGRRVPVPTSTWVAAAAAVAGVFLLTSDGASGGGGASAGANAGDLLCVASAVAFGVHKWRSERIVETLSSSPSSDEGTVRSLVALQLCVLAAASCALCVPDAAGAVSRALAPSSSSAAPPSFSAVLGSLSSDVASLPWPLFAYMGMFTTAWTIDSEARALKHVSSSTAALIYSSEPLWGSFLAAACLGERFEGVAGWAGAALVVGASLASQFGAAAGKGGGGGEAERRE